MLGWRRMVRGVVGWVVGNSMLLDRVYLGGRCFDVKGVNVLGWGRGGWWHY